MTDGEKIRELAAALEAVRVENARFRRSTEDLLYNLEGENMPTVAARLAALERACADLAAGLAAHQTGLCVPGIVAQPRETADGLLPLYIDTEGNLCALKT